MHELRRAILTNEVAAYRDPLNRKERCRRAGESLATIAIPREERRATNQRREDRFPEVHERATLTFRRKKSLVRVVNVSRSGAMVECGIMPWIGETIAIEFEGGAQLEGIVRWVRDGRIGVDLGDGAISLP